MSEETLAIGGLKVYKPSPGQNPLKMMIYGDPGVGKTVLAASAADVPDMSEALFINIEGGLMSIEDPAEVGLTNLPSVVDFTAFSQLDKIIVDLRTKPHPYKTVVVDSLSELQKYNLDAIVEKGMNKVTRSGAKRESMDDIWQEDYGESTQSMRRVVRKLRDLPMNVIMTCHSTTFQDENKVTQVGPLLTPKLRISVIGYLDVLGYMFTKDKKDADGNTLITRHLLVQPYQKWLAKDRSHKLGTFIDNPTMALINKLRKGE